MANLSDIKYIKVTPGIGVARVGNSPTSFIGPEAPGIDPAPQDGKFKDAQGRVKPMSARFRVYGYNDAGEAILELTDNVQNSGTTVSWHVHMANKKAANWSFQGQFAFQPNVLRNPSVQPGLLPDQRTQLHCDPGEKTISGPNATPIVLSAPIFSGISPNGERNVDFPIGNLLGNYGRQGTTKVAYKETTVTIGTLTTDASGRLIVIGGKGEGGSVTDPPTIIKKGPNYFSIKPNGEKYPTQDGKLIENQENINNDPNSNILKSFNNSGWWDDIGGGSIHVEVDIPSVGSFSTKADQTYTNDRSDSVTITPQQARGWVGVAPPKYVPSMKNVVSLLDLQKNIFPEIDPYAGILALAFSISGTGGPVGLFRSRSGAADSFKHVAVGGDQLTTAGPAIVTFQKQLFCAVTGSSTSNLIAAAPDAAGPYHFAAASGTPVATTSSPTLTVFNGKLYYGVLDTNNEVHLASSDDGSSGSFNFVKQTLKLATGNGFQDFPTTPRKGISIAAFQGYLYLAFIGEDNVPYLGIASGQAPDQFNMQPVGGDNASKPSANAPSIAVYDGRLYYAYTGHDQKAYFGQWGNPIPRNPLNPVGPDKTPEFVVNFHLIDNAPNSNHAPAIAGFNGKLYYVVVSEETTGDGGNERLCYVGTKEPLRHTVLLTPGGEETVMVEPPFNFNQVGTSLPVRPAIADFTYIEYFRDIYPIFKTVTDYAYVSKPAFHAHGPKSGGNFLRQGPETGYGKADEVNNQFRRAVFEVIRPAGWITDVPAPPKATGAIPVQQPYRGYLMPHLAGNALGETKAQSTNPNVWLSLTRHQLAKFMKWVNGDFTPGEMVVAKKLDEYPVAQQPKMANFGALDLTVGGGLHPGIEFTWYMGYKEYFCEAFRFAKSVEGDDPQGNPVNIELTPGSIIGYMSTPWHGDFWSCGITFWPPQRPNIVVQEIEGTPQAVNWFRGKSLQIPDDAGSNFNYTHGDNKGLFNGNHTVYQTFLKYWTEFGFVVKNGKTAYYEVERAESERAPCLDSPDGTCEPTSEAGLNIQPALITRGNDYTLLGRVVENDLYASGLLVKAYDKDTFSPDDLLGTDTTDASGEFIIDFKKSDFSLGFFDQNPDVYFEVYRNGTLVKTTKGETLKNFKGETGEIKIDLSS
ncbi:MAG: LodA/GoxA family CTQ-dependent oxidase [Bacteroidota bacterium]